MSLSDVGVAGQQIDVINGGDVDPSGRLLSVAELQQAFRDLRRQRAQSTPTPRRPDEQPDSPPRSTLRPHTSSSPVNAGPHTSPTADADRPHTSADDAVQRPHTSPEVDLVKDADRAHSSAGPVTSPLPASPAVASALGSDWVAVVSAHSGAGASCVALAVADALADTGRACRLIEAAHPARSGLVAAASAELGTDPSGAWRRGSRRLTTLYRRATDAAPQGWPDPLQDAATVVDLGLPAPANVARLVADRPCIVLVCRVTVPGLRLAEQLLAELDGTSIVLAAVGPGRWPGEVAASVGDRVRALREGRRVVTVPDDRRLQVTGPTNSPLPKSVLHAGRELLGLIDAARLGSAGAPPTLTAPPASRTKGTTR